MMLAPERMARARRVAYVHWTRLLDRRRRHAWLRGLVVSTVAATALASLFAWVSSSLWLDAWHAPHTAAIRAGDGVTGVEIASLARVIGGVRIIDPRALARAPRVAAAGAAGAERIGLGTAIDTASDGHAAIAIGELSIRLDVDTRVVLTALDAVRLERGAIHVEAGGGDRARDSRRSGLPMRAAATSRGARIETAFGTVRHLGARFDLRVDDGALRIRVREGVVSVEHAGTIDEARAGDRLIVSPTPP